MIPMPGTLSRKRNWTSRTWIAWPKRLTHGRKFDDRRQRLKISAATYALSARIIRTRSDIGSLFLRRSRGQPTLRRSTTSSQIVCVTQARWADNAAYRTKAIAAEDSAVRRVFRACAFMRLHKWDAAYADMAKAIKIDASDSFAMLSQFANDE